MTSVGLCARSCSNEHPHASILPGPMFSMTTSARPANDRNMSRPSGDAISMLILRMLRVSPANNAVVRTPDGSNSCNWLGASEGAQRLGTILPLDLDHVGAEFRQNEGTHIAGHNRPE